MCNGELSDRTPKPEPQIKPMADEPKSTVENSEGKSGCASVNGSDASTKPKLSNDQIATRLCAMLTQEMMYKADCFDYLCWLEETHQRENVKEAPFLVMASDGTTCWGKNYADCVKVAMNHDKELYDAVKNLVLPEDEHQNVPSSPATPGKRAPQYQKEIK